MNKNILEVITVKKQIMKLSTVAFVSAMAMFGISYGVRAMSPSLPPGEQRQPIESAAAAEDSSAGVVPDGQGLTKVRGEKRARTESGDSTLSNKRREIESDVEVDSGVGVVEADIETVDMVESIIEEVDMELDTDDELLPLQLGKQCYDEENYDDAVKYFRIAIEEYEDDEAMAALGICYLCGQGVDYDPDIAVTYFETAVRKENAEAMCALGICYMEGMGIEQNDQKAFELFEKAAAKDSMYELCHLGFRYEKGYGVPQDQDKAIELYENAAAQGCFLAQYKLDLYYEDLGDETDQSELRPPTLKEIVDSFEEDFNCREREISLMKALERKFGTDDQTEKSTASLSWCSDEVVIKQNLKKSIELCKVAADQGNAQAQILLGLCYENGIGVEQSLEKSIELYRLADRGHGDELYKLGKYYARGKVVKQNWEKAIELYKRAADEGCAIAMYKLGKFYERKLGKLDEDIRLGVKDLRKAFEMYQRAAEKEYFKAQYKLGKCYEDGYVVDQDWKKAAELYAQAAGKGYSIAMYKLGKCYEDGHGVDQDWKKAAELYAQAAGKDYAIAMYKLGECYEDGKGVEGVDLEKAVELYKKAAERGCAAAMCNLGVCYDYGKGVSRDPQKAIELYKQAVKAGDRNALFNLGLCYYNVSNQEAAKWFNEYKMRMVKTESEAYDKRDLHERTKYLLEEWNKIVAVDSLGVRFIKRFFQMRFDRLNRFLYEKGIVSPDKRKSIPECVDVKILSKLLIEAEDALESAKFILNNLEACGNSDALSWLIGLLDNGLCFDKDARLVLTDKFLSPYVLSPWRTGEVVDSQDFEILANMYGIGFSKDLLHPNGEEGENIYDYIFGGNGTYRQRFNALCVSDAGKSRELLAREMHWLRCMTEVYRSGKLSDKVKCAFERCKNLIEVHFMSANGECKNELADVMILWARDIDECEDAMGIGTSIDSQYTFDERFTTAYRQYLAENVLRNECLEYLYKKYRTEAIRKIYSHVEDKVFGQEYKNFYRFLVAHLLNVIPIVGNNLAADTELTSKEIVDVVTKAIDLKDMCKIAQDMYQGLADEKDAQADNMGSDQEKERKGIAGKDPVQVAIEKLKITDSLVIDKFFKAVDMQSVKRFFTVTDELLVEAKNNFEAWVEDKKTLTSQELSSVIVILKAGTTPLKVKLAKTIEYGYEVRFDEFCKIIDITCAGNFRDRFDTFIHNCDITLDDGAKEAKDNLKKWTQGKQTFTISQLVEMVYMIDQFGEVAGESIPELFRFNCALGSRDEKFAEYYAKVLYPIHLLKDGLIQLN